MAGKTFCVAGACALALCLALISHVPSSSGPVGLEGSVSDTQRRGALDAALQRLTSRHARPGRDVRGALEDLEHNLEGELHRNEPRGGQANRRQGSVDESDSTWSKRTMQRGALRGESVEDQLKKVLEHSMDVLLKKRTAWRSKNDLAAAQKVADFIRAHPLPIPRAESRQSDDDDGGVQKIKFQREDRGLTPEQYRELVKALQEAVQHEEDSAAGGDLDSSGEAQGISSRQEESSTERQHASREERFDQARSRREGLSAGLQHTTHGQVFNPELAARKVPFELQAHHSLIGIARKMGQAWVEREILKEHGEFVRLPSSDSMPLPVVPYWDGN